MSSTEARLPDVSTILAQVIQRAPRAQQPLLVALAERMAAARYRRWADEVGDAAQRAELLACADREEEIARRVEALYPEAAAIQRDLLAKIPDLADITRTLFGERPLAQQFAIQANGERLGAATWRSFAQHAEDGAARQTFLGCATLEEANAIALESILGGTA